MSRSPSATAHPVPDLARWLTGLWELQRTLADGDGAPLGTFLGVLEVRPDGPGRAVATERGVLHHGGDRLDATRTLHHELHDDGTVTVRFDHGGVFHHLDLRDGVCDVVHPCAADTYRGRTEVIDADTWLQTWRVSGPTKAYTSVTRATRRHEA